MKKLSIAIFLLLSIAIFAQSDVVAEVNGSEIKKADFKQVSGDKFGNAGGGKLDQHMKEILLDELINQTLIFEDAQSKNLTEDPLYKEMMASFQKKAIVETYIQKFIYDKIELTDEEIMREYKGNWDYFKPERLKVAMVMAQEDTDISEAVNQLKTMDFSQNEMVDANGNPYEKMQTTNAQFMINEVRDDEFFVKEIDGFWDSAPGTFIGPKTIHGQTMAFKILERIPEEAKDFDSVKDEIIERIKERRMEEYVRQHAEELKKNATITIHNNVLNEI